MRLIRLAAGLCLGTQILLSALPSPAADGTSSACTLASAIGSIPEEARALIILDARLHGLVAPALQDYAAAAAQRRHFGIAVLPIQALDNQRPEQVRAALQSWQAAKPRLEGILFVGNVKLPSFFLPRADIHSVRLWPRYFEDLDMAVSRRAAPGKVLRGDGASEQSWPKIVGVKELVVPAHDFDDLAEGSHLGPELWAAFLPVGFQEADSASRARSPSWTPRSPRSRMCW